MSAGPHSPDTFSVCQPKQAAVSMAQVGEMGSSHVPMEKEWHVAPAQQPLLVQEAHSRDGTLLQVQESHGVWVSPQISYAPSKVTVF